MADLQKGEAVESDDESCKPESMPSYASAEHVVYGEASESDEEFTQFGPAKVESYCEETRGENHKITLLQYKLMLSNVAIWKNLRLHLKTITTFATKQLGKTEQCLIKSEVSLQSALSHLDTVQTNLVVVGKKIEGIYVGNLIRLE